MHDRCECGSNPPADRTHLFVDLNNVPYLLGEYMDRTKLVQVDRSAIESRVTVDTSDAMRAVIDISINDISSNPDGSPHIVGNASKSKRFLNMISSIAPKLNGNLPVLKSGIVMRVNYRLEVKGTGHILRTISEDLRITDRSYFLDINRNNFNDNALVTNFSSSIVSTVNEFTHGRKQMVLRITDVQMFYEVVGNKQPDAFIKQTMVAHPYDGHGCCNVDPNSGEAYYYHRDAQSKHYLGNDPGRGQDTENLMLCPPAWGMFNMFYHFDSDGRRIILHNEEIYNPMRKASLLPCGKVYVNRTFVINPGHRLIFKFSVWKNDVTSFYDTLNVAKALKAKFYDCSHHHGHDDCDDHHHRPPKHDGHHHDHHDHSIEYNQLIHMLYEERKKNELNGKTISELLDRISVLEDALKGSGTEVPEEPPVISDGDCECGCDHTDINNQLNDIQERLGEVDDLDPMPEDVIEQIYTDVKDELEGGI